MAVRGGERGSDSSEAVLSAATDVLAAAGAGVGPGGAPAAVAKLLRRELVAEWTRADRWRAGMNDVNIEEPFLLEGMNAMFCACLEDDNGAGYISHDLLTRQLLASASWPLPRHLRKAVRVAFGPIAAGARILCGPDVALLLSKLGASGACVERLVLLGSEALSSPRLAALVLLHELTHLARGAQACVLRCWKGKTHKKLSEKAVDEFQTDLRPIIGHCGMSYDAFKWAIQGASTNMDYRGRGKQPLVSTSYFLTWATKGVSASLFGTLKGEGPRHGEGLNYKIPEERENATLNICLQEHYCQEAARMMVEWSGKVPLSAFDGRVAKKGVPMAPPIPAGIYVPSYDRGWINVLGNALHIAQDRAAHREGRKGYGHDDPRCAEGDWNPDDPENGDHGMGPDRARCSWERCNKAAYERALNNSYDIVKMFLSNIFLQSAICRPITHVPRRTEPCDQRQA